MSELKYCQGTKCHEYKTKDRIKGVKGSKSYQTRRRSNFWYGKGNFCSMNCYNDWFVTHGDEAVDHFGRVTEPKKVMADSAWRKDYKYDYNNGQGSIYNHFLINDLLGQRIPITQQQYDDTNIITPNNLSQ
jgi:hypothetical protein